MIEATVSYQDSVVARGQATPALTGEPLHRQIMGRLAKIIGSRRFKMWFDRSTYVTFDRNENRLDVAVPNRFVLDWIGRHFTGDLKEAAEQELGSAIDVHLRVDHDYFSGRQTAGDEHRDTPASQSDHHGRRHEGPADVPADRISKDREVRSARIPQLRNAYERFSLDRFVVGPSTELAYAAATQLTDSNDSGSGLLFIHGGCGLGKTHLLHGVCGRMRKQKPHARVKYYSAEQFTNEFLAAVRTNKVDAFRAKIRKLDLLAVDDVHFIANKQATQQEFLHSFDAIELGGARLVLASDSHPKQIAQFSEALISRCMRGMVVQVHRPELDTREKIIRSLAERRGVTISEQAVRIVADRCATSIRDLEGVLSKLQALANLSAGSTNLKTSGTSSQGLAAHKTHIDRALAEKLFECETPLKSRKPIRYETISQVVCDEFAVNRAAISGPSRHRHIVLARSLVAYLSRKLTTMSYPEIGSAMGRSTHSTVITATKRIEKQIRENQTFIHPVTSQQTSVVECISRIEEMIDRT